MVKLHFISQDEILWFWHSWRHREVVVLSHLIPDCSSSLGAGTNYDSALLNSDTAILLSPSTSYDLIKSETWSRLISSPTMDLIPL